MTSTVVQAFSTSALQLIHDNPFKARVDFNYDEKAEEAIVRVTDTRKVV